jgi:hypothetical protein
MSSIYSFYTLCNRFSDRTLTPRCDLSRDVLENDFGREHWEGQVRCAGKGTLLSELSYFAARFKWPICRWVIGVLIVDMSYETAGWKSFRRARFALKRPS